MARDVIALVKSDAETHRVRMTLEVAPALPPVQGDRVQLEQVLLNLLLNAMDAMGDRAPARRHVTVRVCRVKKTVELSVSDNGHGIPSEQLTRIFEPFFTTKSNGLGMGLAISLSIVEAHGGRLRAENNPEGGGAVFTFALPVAEREVASSQ
jgi:C4-dicarboxylate-specific signal transduction histidine kinase